MGKFSRFRVVTGERGNLCFERCADIDKHVRTERWLQTLECPFCGGSNFERINLPHALPRSRPGGRKNCTVDHSVIDVKVPGMMRVDHGWIKFLDQLFDLF